MDKGILKALWAGMFILCAVMGFINEPEGFNYWLLVILAVLFFLPPALLLWNSWKKRDEKTLRLIRVLSLISLGSTVVLLAANFLSILASEAVGEALYFILIVVSTPMVCGQFWIIGLLGWALLLWCAIAALKAIKSP